MYTAGECRSVSNLEALVEQQNFPFPPIASGNAPVCRTRYRHQKLALTSWKLRAACSSTTLNSL
jgi:hypothetical protein